MFSPRPARALTVPDQLRRGPPPRPGPAALPRLARAAARRRPPSPPQPRPRRRHSPPLPRAGRSAASRRSRQRREAAGGERRVAEVPAEHGLFTGPCRPRGSAGTDSVSAAPVPPPAARQRRHRRSGGRASAVSGGAAEGGTKHPFLRSDAGPAAGEGRSSLL